jgi:hypothetical protein
MTANNVALADEVTSVPTDGSLLGPLINFQASNTGLPFDFSFADDSPDPGTQVIFVDKGDGRAGLGVGVATTDHDWILGLGADNPYAIGLSIAEATNPSSVDSIDVFDTSSSLLFSLSLEPLGEFNDSMFFGFISDDPIGSIRLTTIPLRVEKCSEV